MTLKSCLLYLVSIIYAISAIEPTTYTYKTVGDLPIEADVYYAPETSSPYTKHPTVLAIHGGGYIKGTKREAFSPRELNEMLSRGWIVVSIDYRLAPGALIDEMAQDVIDAYTWIRTELVKDYPIDPHSIIVAGGSAGGGLAVLSGYLFSPRPNVIVAFYPGCTNCTAPFVYNPKTPLDPAFMAEVNSLRQPLTEYTSIGADDPRDLMFENGLREEKLGWVLTTKDPNESPQKILAILKRYSAVYHVDKDYPPTYLTHGTADTVVPYEQSVEMAAQLKKHHIPYKLDLVEGAEHGYDITNDSQEIWEKHILPAFEFAAQFVNDSEALPEDCS